MPLVREVSIENYKSIQKLTLELGRVNVLIGANGSGKSNLLEAIVYGSSGARKKLDNEYLVPRGIRVTDPRFMRSAFPGTEAPGPIVVAFTQHGEPPLRLVVDADRRALVRHGPPSWESDPIGVIEAAVHALLDKEFKRIEGTVPSQTAHDKQVIFTTHNPAVLDGLDLGDDEQRLFVTERGKDGATRVRRVAAPKPLDGEPQVSLSEAFVRGYLGGLPKNF